MSRRHRRKSKIDQSIHQATVENLSHECRGVSHIDGKALFLQGGLPGETVEFQYTQKKRQLDEGQVTAVTANPSPHRVTPKCQHFAICGGCSLQHIHEDLQVSHKQTVLQEQLQHFANASPSAWLEPLRGPQWAYRRKARLGVKYVEKKSRLLIGFREKNGRLLADLQGCEVLDPRIGKQFHHLEQLIMSLSIYREIPQLEIAMGDPDLPAPNYAIILRHLSPLSESDETKLLGFAREQQCQLYLQSGGPDTIKCLWPDNNSEAPLAYYLEQDVRIHFQPGDFTQVNADINRQMVTAAISHLDLQAEDNMLDLFCGLGNFSLAIAKSANTVMGLEVSEQMIQRAQDNARINNLSNTQFQIADLQNPAEMTPWLEAAKIHGINKVLLDPPRTGALDVIQRLPEIAPERIVYVSCNPATLARDTNILINEQGYELVSAGIMDMFPHTKHVESIACFVKASKTG